MASLMNKAKEMAGYAPENQQTATTTNAATNTTHTPHSHTENQPQQATFNENVFQQTETTKSGPVHHNEVLNKVDPRVHEHKTTAPQARHVPIDAAKAPPSVMKQHLGEPTIEHDQPELSAQNRSSRDSISHQEAHFLR